MAQRAGEWEMLASTAVGEGIACEKGSDLLIDMLEQQDYDPLACDEMDDEDEEGDERALLPDPVPPAEQGPRSSHAVFSPENAGSVEEAVRALVTTNAARRRILLSIIDWARDGIDAEELFERVRAEHADNRSVYEPVSYCRMLERAGALRMEVPEPAPAEPAPATPATPAMPAVPEGRGGEGSEPGACDVQADAAGASLPRPGQGRIAYLRIEEDVAPRWRSTEAGLRAFDELTQGAEWREKVLGEDSVYAEVYLAVMDALQDGGKTKKELADIAEAFEVTRSPRKWGAYFIDVLEATSAIRWTKEAWVLTDLGRRLLPELGEYCATL